VTELIGQALAFNGLPVLILACLFAGIVRGFTGFGTALVFMPMAALVLEPVWAIVTMLTFDFLGAIPLQKKAIRDGEPRDVLLLVLGAVFGLPVGVYLLTLMEPVVFRWLVSCLSLGMLVLLASGWRYRNPLNALCTSLVGAMGGFLSGVAALPGPPIILSYMSSPRPAKVIRGNMIMYLFLVDIMTFAVFGLKGLLVFLPMAIGALLTVPYMSTALVGQRIFNPDKDSTYRGVAYVLIAGSAVAGLPVWD
jgi:uncharacterized membrane protein YfcA